MNCLKLLIPLNVVFLAAPTVAPAQVALSEWAVGTTPSLEVGVVEGSEGEMFVSVFDAALLPDGGVVVLDAGAFELRFFDASGQLVASAGGYGEGPGEFTGPHGVEVIGNSVVSWDYARGTIAYWSTDGDFLHERRIEHHRTFHEGALWPDGSLAIPDYGPDGAREPAAGRYRSQARLLRYANGGRQNLGPFPYEEMLAGHSIGGAIPFRSASRAAAGGSPLQIYIGNDTNQPVAVRINRLGEVVESVELIDTREKITRGHWRSLTESVPGIRGVEHLFEEALAQWGRPKLSPAFNDLFVDPEGRLWVVSTSLAGEQLAIIYENGVALGRVSLPAAVRILSIGQDRLVAVVLGPLDVEMVQVLTLQPL